MVKFNVLTYVSSSHHAFKMNLCTRQWFILAALCALPRAMGTTSRPRPRHSTTLSDARFQVRTVEHVFALGVLMAEGDWRVVLEMFLLLTRLNLRIRFYKGCLRCCHLFSICFACLSLICLQCCLNLHAISPTYPNISQQMEWDQSTNSYFDVLHAFKLQSRKAVMALYPAETRYPKTPWTTALLLMTLIALLSTRMFWWLRGCLGWDWWHKSLEFLLRSCWQCKQARHFPVVCNLHRPCWRPCCWVEQWKVTMGGPILFSTFAACLSRLQPRWRGKDSWTDAVPDLAKNVRF